MSYVRVSIDLDDIDEDDMVEHLRSAGYHVSRIAPAAPASIDKDGGLYIQPADLDRIETLALAGQREPAREWAIDLVSKWIGRPL